MVLHLDGVLEAVGNRATSHRVRQGMRGMRLLTALVVALLATGCGTEDGAGRGQEVWSASPPEGMRWVGHGRVVVAVPEWWTTGETDCLAPVETTVYFDSGAITDCAPSMPEAVDEVSALAVLDARSGYGEKLVGESEPAGEVSGRDLVERDGCERWFEGVCRQVFAVPGEGVVFAVTIHDEGDGDYEQIRDSLRILPEGWTTVPLATADGWTPTWGAAPAAADAVVKAIEAAGLRAEVVTADRPTGANVDIADLPEGSLLDVDPSMGGVIDVGGTVTLTVSGPRPRR